MFRLSFQKKGNNIKISKKEYLLTWVNKSLKKDKYHYEILPCSKPTYNEKYFSNIEDFNQMQLFLNNSRQHLQINNEGVDEGAPYGYATIKQINELTEAGVDIVRVSCPDQDSSLALKRIFKHVDVPIVADIHFNYKLAITAANSGANCLRINPGNIGNRGKVKEIVSCAKDNSVPIRIGVNAGSLEKKLQRKYGEPNADALVESAMNHVNILSSLNFESFVKSSVDSNGINIKEKE